MSTPTQKLVYVDGSLFDSASSTKAVSGLTNIILGHYGTNYADGSIDQIRIFNKGLSSTEILTLYNETKNTTNTLQILGDTSCIATYSFDGSSTDLSGNYNGTDTNILYKYDGTPTAVDFGVGGKTLYGARFNGSSSKIDLGNNSSNNSSTISVSLWFKTSGHSGTATLINNGGANSGETGYYLGLNSNGTIKFEASTGTINGSVNYADNNWHQIVLTLNNGAYNIYVDGNQTPVLTGSGAFTATATRPTWIGQFSYTASAIEFFNGSIDQVRVFNKALSSAEVSKLYGNGAGEVACAYTSTTDNAAYPIANTAYYKLDNNSKDSARSTGKFNEGAIFNGSSSYINLNHNTTYSDLTISAWVNTKITSSRQFIVGKWYDGSNRSIAFMMESGGVLKLITSSTGADTVTTTGGTLTANTWHFVCFTFQNSGDVTITLDGSTTTTTQNTSINNNNQNWLIGMEDYRNINHWNGSIDQVRIYNTALSPTDVSNLYAETASSTNTLSFPSGQTAIATYKLDGNSTDLSGNYSGTDTDVAYAFNGTESNIEYRFGRFGQAAVFNGSNAYINTNYSIPSNTSDYTLSMWIYMPSTSSYGRFLAGNNNSSANNGFYTSINTNGTGRFYLRPSSGTASQIIGSIVMAPGQWHHFVITSNSTTNTLYINGQKDGTASRTTITFSNSITFGRAGQYSSDYFPGKIDQVRVFSSALSSSQVTQLYNEKPEVDTSNFKAVLYKGTSAEQYISNVGMDLETNGGLVWMKSRNNNYNNTLYDSVRGTGTSKAIYSNEAVAENAYPTINNFVSFDANGFTVGATSHANNIINKTGDNLVAWNWKGGGLLNKSASFNGSSSFINLNNTFANNVTQQTWTAWAKFDNLNTQNFILFNENNGGGNGFGFFTWTNGDIYFQTDNTTNSNRGVASSSGLFTTGEWVHFAMVYDGTATGNSNRLKAYINGSLITFHTIAGTIPSTTNSTSSTTQIGSRGGGISFDGLIDQVRIFNKAISSSEVTSLYNETASTINTLQVLGDTSCVAAYPLGVGAGDIGNTYSGTQQM